MSEIATSESSTIDISAKAQDLESRLAAAEKSLSEAREALDSSERKREIERELVRQGAIDIETASMLTEAAVSGLDKKDSKTAIGELKRTKPFLFRTLPRTSAMSGITEEASSLDQAADAARVSGDRRALLRYLRMRRGA